MAEENKKENRKDKFVKSFVKTFKEQYITHQGATVTYLVLRALVVAIMILAFLNHNYENAFMCILALIMFIIPTFIEESFHIEIPNVLEIIILIFIFSANILGEIAKFYVYIPVWDTALHTLNGFLCAAIGLSLFELFNNNEKINFRVSPFFLVLVAFCFSMTIAVTWEFFEFSQDTFFGYDMQKDTIINRINSVELGTDGSIISIGNITNTYVDGEKLPIDGYLDIGLFDTMKDMFVNFIGALIFSIYGYFYEKAKGKKNTWVEKLMLTPMEDDRIEKLDALKKQKVKQRLEKAKRIKPHKR
jgi:hypothetical protein